MTRPPLLPYRAVDRRDRRSRRRRGISVRRCLGPSVQARLCWSILTVRWRHRLADGWGVGTGTALAGSQCAGRAAELDGCPRRVTALQRVTVLSATRVYCDIDAGAAAAVVDAGRRGDRR